MVPMSVFPFGAIVGQEDMKRALLLNAINPGIGGVLVRGNKGTAKTTTVRGLAQLLPNIEVVKDCKFNCDPQIPQEMCDECKGKLSKGEALVGIRRPMQIVELPLGATEDRVVGTIDIEKAIKEGNKVFQPGILAEVHRGILYVDEVNLLDDHLADILLDSAAMGLNIVEREGVSFIHPARFILIGTMNPEEGELRPQLLDRFGLCVEVKGIDDLRKRVEIIRKLEEFEENPRAFEDSWKKHQDLLSKHIVRAKQILPYVRYTEEILNLIAQIAREAKVDGHRSDLFMLKVARTISAYYQRRMVTEADVIEASGLVLPHRTKKRSLQKSGELKQQTVPQFLGQRRDGKSNAPTKAGADGDGKRDPTKHPENVLSVSHPFPVKKLGLPKRMLDRCRMGRRSKARLEDKGGRYVGSVIPEGETYDIAMDATIRAAAPYQMYRQDNGCAIVIELRDIRRKVRERKVSHTIVFVVDTSSSMGTYRRMVETKGAILSLLIDAYQKRDRVAMVTFRAGDAEILLPPTNNIELAKRKLEKMPTGGGTSLSKGLHVAHLILKSEMRKNPHIEPLLVLISDGEANMCLNGGRMTWGTPRQTSTSTKVKISALEEAKWIAARIKQSGIKSIVIDTRDSHKVKHKMEEICKVLGGTYYKTEDIKAETLVSAVKRSLFTGLPSREYMCSA